MKHSFLFLIGILFALSQLQAQPANDDPCSAIALMVSPGCQTSSYTNTAATASTAVTDPTCSSYMGADVWFTATVPASGKLMVNMIGNGGLSDGAMAAYAGTCTSLAEIACNDDFDGLFPQISMAGLTPGQTIYIRAYGYDGEEGSFDLCAMDSVYMEYPPVPGFSASKGYNSTEVVLDFWSQSNYVNIYRNTVNDTSTAISISDWTKPMGSNYYVDNTVSPGQKYYYWARTASVITGEDSSAFSSVDSGWVNTALAPPANDEPCDAISLTLTDDTLDMGIYSNQGATRTELPSDCGSGFASSDIWFKATAASNGLSFVLKNENDSIFEWDVAVYSGSCASLTEINCDMLFNYDDIAAMNISPGQDVYLRVYSGGTSPRGPFKLMASDGASIEGVYGINATKGMYSDHIGLSWEAAIEATHFNVYRNTVNDFSTATSLTGWSNSFPEFEGSYSYDDSTAVKDQPYYYWVLTALSSSGAYHSDPDMYALGLAGTLVQVESITLAESNDSVLTDGGYVEVTASITPSDASFNDLNWFFFGQSPPAYIDTATGNKMSVRVYGNGEDNGNLALTLRAEAIDGSFTNNDVSIWIENQVSHPVLDSFYISPIVDCGAGSNADSVVAYIGPSLAQPLTYNWGNGSTGERIYNVPQGNYTLIVTDTIGQQVVHNFSVTGPGPLLVVLNRQNICDGQAGSITANVSGGTSPYSYLWNNASTGASITGITGAMAGIYTVTVTDGFGCSQSWTDSVKSFGLPTVSASSNSPVCIKGQLSLFGTASNISSWSWTGPEGFSSAQQNPVHIIQTNTEEGTYTLTARDMNGCSSSATTTVEVKDATLAATVLDENGTAISGKNVLIELYVQSDTTSGKITKKKEITSDAQGTAKFTALDVTKYYYLKANTKPMQDSTYLNSWYNSGKQGVSTWQTASFLQVSCGNETQAEWKLIKMTLATGGNGVISGNIYYPEAGQGGQAKSISIIEGQMATGEPVPGAEIILEQEPDDSPVGYTISDDQGAYEFNNLPDAEYSMEVQIPGMEQTATYQVKLEEGTNQQSNLNFMVDTATQTIDTIYVQPTGIGEDEASSIRIVAYPNPFATETYVEYTLPAAMDVQARLIATDGTIVATPEHGTRPAGEYRITIKGNGLKPGIYYLSLRMGSQVYLKKLVKQ